MPPRRRAGPWDQVYGGYLNAVDVVVDPNQGNFHFVIGRDGRPTRIGPACCKARPDVALALMWQYSHIDRYGTQTVKSDRRYCLYRVCLPAFGRTLGPWSQRIRSPV